MYIHTDDIIQFIVIALLIAIVFIYIQWWFIKSAVKAGVKQALEDVVVTAKLEDNKDNDAV